MTDHEQGTIDKIALLCAVRPEDMGELTRIVGELAQACRVEGEAKGLRTAIELVEFRLDLQSQTS